jgi:hypothetical protein
VRRGEVRPAKLHFFFLVALGSAASTVAQTTVDNGGEVKTLTIMRLAMPPTIDGVLDEPAWANATLVTDLHQLDPVEYAPPSQRSEIRLYYDDDALYVSARLWDTEADRITAQVLRQGEGLGSEDRFSVILDPYLDRRTVIAFRSIRTAFAGRRCIRTRRTSRAIGMESGAAPRRATSKAGRPRWRFRSRRCRSIRTTTSGASISSARSSATAKRWDGSHATVR